MRTDKVYLYNKTLILQIDKRLARNFWRSGGRKPSAVALFKPSNIKINSSEKMNEFIPPSISIVIPVFNVEKYIGECLDSLLLQTFDKFEVICIIDGSTDNSENIIKSGKYQSLNLKIINIPNSGQSIARNIGIHNATGEFILFLDSDDKIRNDTLKKCIEELEENELDGVFFEGQAFSNTLKKNKMKK
ncbi:TPA: glycosyltransferase family 2 protein, partial [Proteus mirabilis]